jgi:HK97 family phage portal protein
MGLFSRSEAKVSKPSIEAQYEPRVMGDAFSMYYPYSIPTLVRSEAMSVPTVARCRNLIASTIAATPLSLYKKSTGEELGNPVWLDQPSYSQPRSVTIAWTVDSLLMFGVAYWEVTETYADDGRPARFQWVANDRVNLELNRNSTEVQKYYVDGYERPQWGLGSLITFQGLDEGILTRGARTLQAAIDLDKASAIASSTPQPTGFIKNSGADLDPKEVSGLLAAWKQARNNRSTAYLTSTLDYVTTSYSPKDMMYNEAKQFLSTEISRLMNVPAIYVSADMNSSYNYTNVLDSRKDFVSYSLQPFISAIEDRLSMDDVTTRGNEVRFDLDSTFLRSDPMAELLVIEKLLSLGLITTEQAMGMTDLSPNGSGGMA